MKQTRIHLEWYGTPARQFRTGLSLHSHTLHSRETLSFLTGWPAALLPSGTLWNAAKPAIAPSEALRTVDVIDSVHAIDTNQQNMADATFIFVIKPTLRIRRRRQ